MSEAGTGNIQKLFAVHLRITIGFSFAAVAFWVAAIASVVGVVADRLPDLIAGVLLTLAGCATVGAINFGAGYARQRLMAQAVVEPLGTLAAQQEQLAAKLGDNTISVLSTKGGDFWQGYAAGVDDLNGGVASLDAKRRAPN